jgi:hypothetical protein
MNNYIQKINSRSGAVAESSDAGGQLLQPETRPAFSKAGTDFFEQEEQINTQPGPLTQTTESTRQSPMPGYQSADDRMEKTRSDQVARTDHSTTSNINEPAFKLPVHLQPSRETQMGVPKQTKEPISLIIERINETIHSHTMPINFNDSARMDKDPNSFAGKNIVIPNSTDPPARHNDPGEEGKRGQLNDQTSKKNLLSPSLVKNIEKLIPAKDQRPPDIPTRKTPATSKLVIGRITVEVVNPVSAPVKTNEPHRRPDRTQHAPAREFKGIDKLHFGLGQL